MNKILKLSLVAVATLSLSANAGTLENVKKAGELKCGVSTGLAGFSEMGADKKWRGLDVDYCRAVAAAVLGDAAKVKFVPLTAKERFTALQSGEIDVLSRNTTWTNTRDTSLGLDFAGVNYYDGQGFLVTKKIGVNKLSELDGATFCIQAGTTTELNLADYFKANGMSYKQVTYDTSAQVDNGFRAGRCDVITTDQSALYAALSRFENKNDYKVLPNIISKEPLGPVVRQGDDTWYNIARWTLNAMITAEELRVTSKNVNSFANTKNPGIQKLLGTSGKLGKNLGLDASWAKRIIAQVGNYEESFNRNVGPKTPLNISRGVNALWNKGGILYSPAMR